MKVHQNLHKVTHQIPVLFRLKIYRQSTRSDGIQTTETSSIKLIKNDRTFKVRLFLFISNFYSILLKNALKSLLVLNKWYLYNRLFNRLHHGRYT